MLFARCLAVVLLLAASRQHTVVLGKWHAVKTMTDSGASGEIRVRKLLVDGRVVDYTSGPAHTVTDRVFVIRRANRINDALPGDKTELPQWIWRLDGWISVDRFSGRVTLLNLPAFDPEISQASWYRDFAAYCGTSDDGAKAYLVVSQLGKRKPILRKEFSGPGCPPPQWERRPSRVTFIVAGSKSSFIIGSRGAEPEVESSREEGPP